MDILRRRTGYAFFTKLDISMQYYTLELDDETKNLCVIITPFGKYCYNRLPMGVLQSPDIAQEVMEDLLHDVENLEVYIDDIGCFDSSWEQHLQTLERVLQRLQDNGFTINPLKCEWATKETDWLGYWLTPSGLRPWKKKIDAILKMRRPTTIREVRAFIGAVSYYRDMFPHRSHILAPLTTISGQKGPLNWTDELQQAFDQMKAIIAQDIMLRYPDHNEPFHVYTDASALQLGAVIMQNDHPIAYYSRKLSPAQRNYTTIEKELLSIVETLKEFRTMLYGCTALHIHTDHRNLTYSKLTSERVLRWRLYLEEFHPIFHYIKGEDNIVADALSRLPRHEGEDPFPSNNSPLRSSCERSALADEQASPGTSVDAQEFAFSILDDQEMLECFLNFPDVDHAHPFVLDFEHIRNGQQQDLALLAFLQREPMKYANMLMANNVSLIVYIPEPGQPWKICIPSEQLDSIILFYHQALNHLGIRRTVESMKMHFYHPQLRARSEHLIKTCPTCQKVKQALQTAAYAVRTAIHGTMKVSPGAMVFQRDMLLNIPIIADFELLRDRREALINEQLIRANQKRIQYDYQPGQQVLLREPNPNKLDPRGRGPYLIDRVHTNGTVTIRLTPLLTNRINIRRIQPFFS
jgi:RNase H-like domain found in reverse transcriptase/Reverse transcriptase (RNA-dependent DNA polymerase)/Integrase zinc binding domain